MKYSIIVPTYNEENDIRKTLESLIILDWHDFEIIVVDDSSDNTSDIVREFIDKGVKLIIPEVREGRCGARNLGVQSATGDVVIILNADTRLPVDFIKKINAHYEKGDTDYLLVSSTVENMENLFARYVECTGIEYYYSNPKSIEWTEGFSCRKDVAIKAGLFPTGFAVPICAGEDGFFGDSLRAIGAKRTLDVEIYVSHVAPASFSEYWHIRKGRGQGSPQVRRFLEGWSYGKIRRRATLRAIYNFFCFITVLPVLLKCLKFALHSPKKYLDIIPFAYAWAIEQLAFTVGEFKSLNQIIKREEQL